MTRNNGGIIGKANIPTLLLASGVWDLRQQSLSRLGGTWPITSLSTWNPLDKDADVTLSNGNKTASVTSALGVVRGTLGHDMSGDYYFEVTVTSTNHLVGVLKSTAELAHYVGYDANGWAYESTEGKKYTNATGAAYGATWGNGAVIGVRISGGSVVFYKNGTSQGTAYSGLTGTVYPAWGPGTSGAGTRTGTINTGETSFVALPSGSAAWG